MIAKKCKEINLAIVLNVLFAKKENIYPAYVLKHNSNCKKQYSFSDFKWKGIGLYNIKKLSALLRRITSKHYNGFCCLNCLHSFAAEQKIDLDEKLWKNRDFCNIVMPFEDIKILKFKVGLSPS